MTKASLLVFLASLTFQWVFGQAQVPITSITYTPQNPTWADTIVFVCITESVIEPFPVYSEQIEVLDTNIHADICYHQSPWISVITLIDSISVNVPVGSTGLFTFHYRMGTKNSQDSCIYVFQMSDDTVGIGGTVTFEVNEPNGLDETNQTMLRLFPNPATEFVTLESKERFTDVWLTDMFGRRLLPFAPNGTKWEVGVGELPSGIYMVAAFEEDGRRAITKLVKQ